MAKAKKKTIHYIDNSKFLEEMIKHRDGVAAAKLKGEISPPFPEVKLKHGDIMDCATFPQIKY